MAFGFDAGFLAVARRSGVDCDAFFASSTADPKKYAAIYFGRRVGDCCRDDCMSAVGWPASAKLKHEAAFLGADQPNDRLPTSLHCFCVRLGRFLPKLVLPNSGVTRRNRRALHRLLVET